MYTLVQDETSHNPLSYHSPVLNRSHNLLGVHGEQFIERLFVDAGYIVRSSNFERFQGDLSVTCRVTGEVFKIEVKTSLENNRGNYGFCTRKAGHTDCSYSDFVALLCIDKNHQHYLYIIPVSCLNGQFASIASHPTKYKGKYAPFRIRARISLLEVQKTAELWGKR